MFYIVLLLTLAGLGLLVRAYFCAPVGHEDTAGFHLGDERWPQEGGN